MVTEVMCCRKSDRDKDSQKGLRMKPTLGRRVKELASWPSKPQNQPFVFHPVLRVRRGYWRRRATGDIRRQTYSLKSQHSLARELRNC